LCVRLWLGCAARKGMDLQHSSSLNSSSRMGASRVCLRAIVRQVALAFVRSRCWIAVASRCGYRLQFAVDRLHRLFAAARINGRFPCLQQHPQAPDRSCVHIELGALSCLLSPEGGRWVERSLDRPSLSLSCATIPFGHGVPTFSSTPARARSERDPHQSARP